MDCDCVAHPAPVKLADYGILASLDPVALDQQHGTHTIDWAEKNNHHFCTL